MPPIITLTTDFGLRDPWVGIMKGVLLGLCPEARLVDLTHEVAPQDVLEAQVALASAVPFFPPGSIHLAVVDPQVGGPRRALGLASGGQYFVGPDNGLFTFALDGAGWSAADLTAHAFRLSPVSRTFHGRDVLAPAAAALARGVPLDRLGPRVSDPVRRALPLARRAAGEVVGEVIGNDRFGNLLTSITEGDLAALAGRGRVVIEIGGRALGTPVGSYAEARPGEPAPIIGSQGRVEIFVREGDARAALGACRGTPVRARAD